ncbi:MAG: hypothetical protein HC828_00630 [Blastochloris sp.]|nr:hypothetical protein [Blastochloris sp.]
MLQHDQPEPYQIASVGLQEVVGCPGGEGCGILYGGRAHTEQGADLGTVLFTGPPAPLIVEVDGGINLNLPGEEGDDGCRHLVGRGRKAAVELEALEQDSEA